METIEIKRQIVETLVLIAGEDYTPEMLRPGASGRSMYLTPAARRQLLGDLKKGQTVVDYPERHGKIYVYRTTEEPIGGTDK